MNDPREAKQWSSTGTLAAAGDYTDAEMKTRVNDVLRRSARLLAMTVDREPTPGADPATLFHRGWGRAPLWVHYADDHCGVCLVLDPAAVNEALHDGLPPRTGRYLNWGRINYADKPIRIDLKGTVTNQAFLDEKLDAFLGTKWKMSGLHMTKNTDWDYETELRLAVVELGLDEDYLDTPVDIPLGDCLKAVIFGDLHLDPGALAHEIQGALGDDSPEFFQCHWIDGAPALEPLTI